MRRLLILSLIALALGGCTVGPNYVRPAVDTPPSWRMTDTEAKDLANTAWWGQFNDPVLDNLIATALRENLDLQIASARVDEFAGRYGFVRADLFPQVGANAAAGRQRYTEETGNTNPPGTNFTLNNYSATLGASWEIDVWGRIRRATEAARARTRRRARKAAGPSSCPWSAPSPVPTSTSATSTASWRSRRRRRSPAGSRWTSSSSGSRAGFISEVEYVQVKSQYEEALASIPAVEKAITQQENALERAAGPQPGADLAGKDHRPADAAGDPGRAPLGPARAPARHPPGRAEPDRRQRPDRRREGRVLSDHQPDRLLRIRQHRPVQSLHGARAGLEYSAPITMPIFTAGKIAGDVQAAEAIQRQALVGYRQAIQTAFREVDDSLVDQARTREQLAAQGSQVEALQKYVELARLRFDNGYTSYLEVLDAERSLFNVQLSYTQTQGVLFQAMINLYKAMGGGWVTEADKLTAGATGPAP